MSAAVDRIKFNNISNKQQVGRSCKAITFVTARGVDHSVLLEQNKNMLVGLDPHSLERLRVAVSKMERAGPGRSSGALAFGIEQIDARLPGGGLATDALHEVTGTGVDIEFAAAPALFAAGILARRPGPVLWILERRDLFAPALAAAGLQSERVIYAETRAAATLLVMEEGLKHAGVAGVVAEVSTRVSLTASRRLHLAAQAGNTMALMLRRCVQAEGAIAAVTRWRIGPEPSASPVPRAAVQGLGRMRWRLELTRSRGGRTGEWITEACDATGRLGLVSSLADRSVAPAVEVRRRIA